MYLVNFQWRWLMESCGPDLIWWDNWDKPNGWETFYYDPSNGTISSGQLAYFEGGYVFPNL